jgi:hypothetical protein
MSSPKFAAMTANLLVRKGEAAPSPLNGSTFRTPERPFAVPAEPRSAPAAQRAPAPWSVPAIETVFAPPPPADPARPRKIIVALSPAQHEILAIAAVKTGKTRPQMMRDALATYLTNLARDVGEGCACLAHGAQGGDMSS